MEAAANVAMAANAALSLTAPECNTVGAALIGGSPLTSAFEAVKDGSADTVIILENDLYRRAPTAEVDAFLGAAKHVIVLDHLANPTTEKAELELPAGTFAESDGTFISSEGRAQRFFQVFAPQSEVLASWRWLKPDELGESGRCACGSVEGVARTRTGVLCRTLSRVSNRRRQDPALAAPRERPDRSARQHQYFRAEDT